MPFTGSPVFKTGGLPISLTLYLTLAGAPGLEPSTSVLETETFPVTPHSRAKMVPVDGIEPPLWCFDQNGFTGRRFYQSATPADTRPFIAAAKTKVCYQLQQQKRPARPKSLD